MNRMEGVNSILSLKGHPQITYILGSPSASMCSFSSVYVRLYMLVFVGRAHMCEDAQGSLWELLLRMPSILDFSEGSFICLELANLIRSAGKVSSYPPVSTSPVLGFQACSTMPGFLTLVLRIGLRLDLAST